MLSHRNLITNAYNTTALNGLDETARYLHAAPMFHLADGCGTFAAALVAAGICTLEKFEPLEMLKVIEQERVSAALLVPSMINMLVNHPEYWPLELSSLRHLAYGGSPMPEAVIRKTLEVLPHVRLTQAYGQSEASPCLTINPHEYHAFSGPRAERSDRPGAPCTESNCASTISTATKWNAAKWVRFARAATS